MLKPFRCLLLTGSLWVLSVPAFAGYLYTFTAPDVAVTSLTSGPVTYPGFAISVTLPALYTGPSIWSYSGSAFAALDPVITGGAPDETVTSLEIHSNLSSDEATFGVSAPSLFAVGAAYRFMDNTVAYSSPGFYPQNNSILQAYPTPGVVLFDGTVDISTPEPATALLGLAGIVAVFGVRRLT